MSAAALGKQGRVSRPIALGEPTRTPAGKPKWSVHESK
jgi:hypothetical protein